MSIESLKYSSYKNSIKDSQVKQIPVQYLIIAGGGSGGRGGNSFSGSQGTGGGGAGGYISTVAGEKSGTDTNAGDPHTVNLGQDYVVDIGAGSTSTGGGFSGQGTTTFDSIVAVPGGGGGVIGFTNSFSSGGTGGSSGGGGNSFHSNRHYPGQGGRPGQINQGSGGGGAANVEDTSNRNGLPGLSSSITGSSVERAGGGAGNIQNSNSIRSATGGGGTNGGQSASGTAGAVNTGGGGGAGGNGNSNNNRGAGGTGGSGVAIFRYDKKYTISVSAGLTAGTETVDGDEKYIEITAGTGTVSWG
tara:strand:+ start:362 stop:1267 length:906 start_codon:yes stop_codon:yes gene_type:complete